MLAENIVDESAATNIAALVRYCTDCQFECHCFVFLIVVTEQLDYNASIVKQRVMLQSCKKSGYVERQVTTKCMYHGCKFLLFLLLCKYI